MITGTAVARFVRTGKSGAPSSALIRLDLPLLKAPKNTTRRSCRARRSREARMTCSSGRAPGGTSSCEGVAYASSAASASPLRQAPTASVCAAKRKRRMGIPAVVSGGRRDPARGDRVALGIGKPVAAGSEADRLYELQEALLNCVEAAPLLLDRKALVPLPVDDSSLLQAYFVDLPLEYARDRGGDLLELSV